MKDSTGLILLAAGNSKRMGQCKFLLSTRDGITFFENIIHSFSQFGVRRIIVVTQRDKIARLNELCSNMIHKPILAVNEHPEFEKFYSLQLGIEKIGDVDHCYIHNADSPFIDLSTLDSLHINKTQANYICPVFNGKGGHPILVDKQTLQFLKERPVNSILSEELKSLKKMNISVEDEMVSVDIDTPEEYKMYFR